MMFVAISVMFGLVAAALAWTKARSLVAWFMAGVIIGPFALVVLALPPITRHADLAECPICFELVQGRADACGYCGSAFD
jgi:predicted membrane metal-binding protein